MNTTTEFRRRVPHKAVSIVFAIIGIAMVVTGVATRDGDPARTGLLCGFGALCALIGLVVLIDNLRKTKRDERVRVLGDRIEVATSSGVTRYPFATMTALEAKIIVVQATGQRIHAFRLVFAAKELELVADAYTGIDADTGTLLALRAGKPITAWL